jgi:hypothetical protein
MTASPCAVTDGGLMPVFSCAWTLDANRRRLIMNIDRFM